MTLDPRASLLWDGRHALRLAGVLLALSLATATPAWGHPHVFVDVNVGVSFGERGLEAIHFGWRFDEGYSASLFFYLDRDASGAFTPAAVAELERHLRGLAPLGYLVEVEVNGAAAKVGQLRDFRAPIERECVVNVFTLEVSPSGTSEGVVRIDVVDPGFYIAFTLLEPVRVEAAGPYRVECRVARDLQTNRPEGVRCDYRRRVS